MAHRNGDDDAIYDVDGYPLLDAETVDESKPDPDENEGEDDGGT
ncbi:hypothetical protein [Streptomyces ochraceiscleroticus]|uniref:Uncharacterized protein n=1 Tax=Streptomyces ochraceiscleroticus TaxID=47761 RepID=A0ABW1MMU1_9ACTN|nr:hypothetical protein [Streptomyces ochraceiscleroticus]